MRPMLLILALTTVVLAPRATPAGTLLSDAELDTITAGTDVCALVGLSAPCTISFIEVFQPGATPVTKLTAITPPPSGDVKIKQRVRVPPGDGAFSTSVRQKQRHR